MPDYQLNSRNHAISTDYEGYCSLLGFYNFAKTKRNCWIELKFDGISFIDANLSSLLYAMIHHLKNCQQVKTFIDFKVIKSDLNVLSRNGFITHVLNKNFVFTPFDPRDSTIPLSKFTQQEVDSYVSYIEKDFLHQRGLDSINFQHKTLIKNSYFEIFDNVGIHANTKEPIFVCGQYFPKQGEVKFTLVDLGEGFLAKISEFTKSSDKIIKAADAISWAIKGNSTKMDAKGGMGLKKIWQFCKTTGGSMHIISDNCYFEINSKSILTHSISNPFKGTTIHLIFRFL